MRLEQQTIGTSAKSSGSQDVPLFAFVGIAGSQDVYITTLKLKSLAGSLSNAENYRLLLDRDGDGIVESLYGAATPSGETLAFGNLNILIRDGQYTRVELWADVKTSVLPSSISVGFSTGLSDFVEAVGKSDGAELNGIVINNAQCTVSICWISVITDTSQTVSLGTRGNLFVTLDTVPIGDRQIIASTETPSLLLLKFRAEAEDVIVKELAITGVPSGVDTLRFYAAGSPQPFAIGKSIHCSTVVSGRFCADKDFIVSQHGEMSVIVKAVLKSDTQGAVSGQTVTLSINDATTGSSVAVQGEGYDSGQQLAQNNGDSAEDGEVFIGTSVVASNSAITGPTHTIVLAKIVDITNTNPDPPNSPISLGAMQFARFGFRAANHENIMNGPNTIVIDRLAFTVSAVNVTFEPASFRLYNIQNSGTTHNCVSSGTTGTITVTCSGLAAGDVSTTISRGDTINLALQGTVTGVSETGISILQASLNNLSNPASTGTVEWSDGNTTIDWVDLASTQVKSTNYRLE